MPGMRTFRRAGASTLAAGPVLLLLTLLPSLLSVDHWTAVSAAEASGAATHQGHCHSGPATCAEQPVPPNLRSFADLIEMPEPDLTALPLEDAAVRPIKFLSPPPVEPPRV